MHEWSVAQALVGQVERVAARESVRRVTRVSVVVGQLSGVDGHCLRMAFAVASDGTAADGAALDIEERSATVRCRTCGVTSTPIFPFLQCPECQGTEVAVVHGRELMLKSVDVETD
jgi:hydrogenase nickel incorporation protein HypA/HybF